MSVSRTRLAPLGALLATSLAFADLAQAQVPEGSAVVCTYTDSGVNHVPGLPGLFIVPLAGGPMTSITGLPAQLTTDGGGAYKQGAFSVSLRSADGAVIVGTITDAGAPTGGVVELFVFHLNGSAVDPARTQQIVLGTAMGRGAAWTAVMPDGRILVRALGNGPLPAGPMAGRALAIVDTSGPAPAFTLLPNPNSLVRGMTGNLALDPTGQFLYFLSVQPGTPGVRFSAPTSSRLLRYAIATGQTCHIASWPGEAAHGITCDDDGTVYVSSTDLATVTHFMHTVQSNGCNPATVTTVQSSLPLLAWGLDFDRASGRFAATSVADPIAGFAGPQLGALSLIDRVSGAATVVGSPPAGGWGSIGMQGVAVNNAIESYGARSDGENRYWFDNFPNPGGQPTIGNTGFSLTMASAPNGAVLSALALSFGRGSTTMFGATILVDPASTVVQFGPSGLSVPYALPIPNNAGLSGLVLTAQSLHLEAMGGLAASRGLTLTLQ